MPQTPNHVVVNHTRALPDVVKEAISARNQQIPLFEVSTYVGSRDVRGRGP